MLHKKKPPRPPDDELTARLRAAARKRRPWSPAGIAVLLLLILIPAGLFIWLLSPRPEPPPLEVIAFDQLGVPGAEVTLRACLEPIQPPEESLNLSGYSVTFDEELLPLKPARERRQIKAVTNAEGEANAAWTLASEKSVQAYVARQIGDRLRPGKSDRAQLFSWQAGTALLIVDVPETLAVADMDSWRKRNVLDIVSVPGAGKALQEARKRKFEIVYLATEPESALIYRKMRSWVANQKAGREPLPPGPVLGRSSLSLEASQVREAVLRQLRQQFTAELVTVVGSSEAAATCRGVGIETIVIGGAEAPVDVVRVKAWSELSSKLGRK